MEIRDGEVATIEGPGTWYPEAEHARLNAILRERRLRAEVAEAKLHELQAALDAAYARVKMLEYQVEASGYEADAARARMEAAQARLGPLWKRFLRPCFGAGVGVQPIGTDAGSANLEIFGGLCFTP